MNVAPARNCVSTSHFAAATCHYCTITVCTTIVASRTSLASLTITLEIVLDFCTKKKKKKEKRHARVSIVYYGSSSKSRSRVDEYPGRAVQKSSFYSITFFFSRSIRDLARSVSFPFSFPVRAFNLWILCAHQHYTFESYYTRWLLTGLCLFSV